MMAFAEDNYENSVIQLFTEMGYKHLYGPEVERDYRSPFYDVELEESIRRINTGIPEDAIQDALFRLRNIEIGELAQKNEVFMDYLQNGIGARYYKNGEERSDIVRLIDYAKPQNNSFIVANQWTFIENSNKRPDVILFINGLPLVLIELKSPSREDTDVSEAYRQLRNYMIEIPTMFVYNA
ncbi:MAG: type I restriction endonuclease, partial [Christensenellaceae bacterium]